jgi:ubiquinone/menaquinone biosynthesis methyltransferase
MDDPETQKHRKKVQNVFNQVVSYYDTMNDLLSFGLHRLWKLSFIRSLALENPKCILDLSTGTGDILIALLKKYPKSQLIAVDPDPQMLRYAQLKVAQNDLGSERVQYIECTAEKLGLQNFQNLDLLTCSFGLRNMSNIPLALKNMHQSLKPGSVLKILEFSPNPQSFRLLYRAYRTAYLPFIGKIVFNDPQSYAYLSESIEKFHTPEQVKFLIESAGFREVYFQPYAQGIVYQYEARA